jgi:deoxyribodipyrimidine photo-lyase
LKVDSSVGRSPLLNGGEEEAERLLRDFIENKLMGYDSDRNDPSLDGTSQLSAYLHFGNISPVRIALAALKRDRTLAEPFLEELIVRRELSFNFVRNNPHYDSFKCLPNWAVKTLREHEKDKRTSLYKLTELENALTLDPAWNAAQLELLHTGRIHGYMRMYWGKKILEWTASPEEAYETAIRLNDKYELDGRDPNGYAGVAWCFGKHDRPWAQGPVFGTVRRMTQSGLRRKFDLEAYICLQSEGR